MKNFNEHIYKEIQRSYRKIKEEYLLSVKSPAVDMDEKVKPEDHNGNMVPYFHPASNTSERMAALARDINNLLSRGLSIREISRSLNIARNTVRSYLNNRTPPVNQVDI